MNFDFDESNVLLRKSVREFARAEIAPYAAAWDSEERFPLELVPKLASMGLLGIRIPEEYGGSGMDTPAYALSIEEIALRCGFTNAFHFSRKFRQTYGKSPRAWRAQTWSKTKK